MSARWDWLYLVTGWTLAGAALAFLLLALLRDRSRGRRRCPRCWYDMAATPGLTCPECGRDARAERRLHKTRRRWKLAAFSLLLLPAAYLTHSWPLIKAGGWAAPIPTRVLLEIYPFTGPGTKLGDELTVRTWLTIRPAGPIRTPTDEQLAMLITRASRGNWLARPLSDRWKRSYGELLRLLRTRVSFRDGNVAVYPGPRILTGSIDPAIKEWLSVPPAPRIRTRPKWPRGMPIAIDAEPETWWPECVTDSEEIIWSVNDGQAQGKGQFRYGRKLDIGLRGHIVVEGTIKVFQRDSMMQDQPTRHAASSPFRFEYDTVDSIDDIMQAATSPALEAFLTSGVTPVWDAQRGGMQFTLTQPMPPGFSDVAFAIVLEVLAGDRIIMTHHMRGIDIAKVLDGLCIQGDGSYADNDEDAARLRRGDVDSSWRLRIRTDPQGALSELDATRYWKGDFTIPMTAGKFDTRVRTTRTPVPAAPPKAPAPPPK